MSENKAIATAVIKKDDQEFVFKSWSPMTREEAHAWTEAIGEVFRLAESVEVRERSESRQNSQQSN